MTIVTPQYTLKEACDILGVSPKQLAKLTGLHPNTVKSAINGGKFNTHVGTALLIADALGMEMHEIIWPVGTSESGRPPLTGMSSIERSVTITVKQEVVVHHAFCHRCHLQLPLTMECDNCS